MCIILICIYIYIYSINNIKLIILIEIHFKFGYVFHGVSWDCSSFSHVEFTFVTFVHTLSFCLIFKYFCFKVCNVIHLIVYGSLTNTFFFKSPSRKKRSKNSLCTLLTQCYVFGLLIQISFYDILAFKYISAPSLKVWDFLCNHLETYSNRTLKACCHVMNALSNFTTENKKSLHKT